MASVTNWQLTGSLHANPAQLRTEIEKALGQ